ELHKRRLAAAGRRRRLRRDVELRQDQRLRLRPRRVHRHAPPHHHHHPRFLLLHPSQQPSPPAGPPPPPRRAAARRLAEQETTAAAAGGDLEAGIDEDTLKSYPKVRYSHAKLGRDVAGAASCCSICLSDYKDADVLRELPECGHLFHVKCVDPWLRLRPTCPLCRTSPLPSPLPTPLADAVPLSTLARHP
ncbi:unnamed protein product, partial [Musa textilis]